MTDRPSMYVISLKRSAERLRRFFEMNDHLRGQVDVFTGVDGLTLDREDLVKANYVTRGLSYGRGTLGCSISHLKLWELAVSLRQPLTVFEDDAVVALDFVANATSIMAGLPSGWSIVQWGCMLNPAFAWVDLGVTRARLEGYGGRRESAEQLTQFQQDRSARAAVRLLHSFGMQGYTVSPSGAQALLEQFTPLRDRMITFPDAEVTTTGNSLDVQLCAFYPTTAAFLCVPFMVIQAPGKSDRSRADEIAAEIELG